MSGGFPPPEAFGLGFSAWRADQLYAFQLILDTPHRYVGLTMPTGSGKSLAYMAAMIIGGGRGVALTSTKGLQDQLGHDFSQVYDIRGQRNYQCLALQGDGELVHLREPHGDGTCDEGPCHAGVTCTLKEAGCLYFDRLRIAPKQPVLSMNYAAWLAHRLQGRSFGTPDLLVLDEAHHAPDELSQALTISLDKNSLQSAGVTTHPEPGLIQPWKDWAGYHGMRLKKRLESLGVPTSAHEIGHRRRLKAVERVLGQLAGIDSHNWIEDHEPWAWRWEVLNPAKYSEPLLFQGAKKIVLASATLNAKTLALLGIPASEALLWECPSRFPVVRRPVLHIPTCQVDNKMKPEAWDQWIARIDGILSPRGDRKGIIHTKSYKRRDVVLARSQFSERMVTHESKDLVPKVMAFKTQPGSQVLVSPSVVTGWDFPHQQCRFQIIAKVPFPDTRNKVIKARAEIDPDYVPYLVMQELVQAVGRGMRAEDDWCETFIIDDHWVWFGSRYRRMAPQWFHAAVRKSLTLPKPLVFNHG